MSENPLPPFEYPKSSHCADRIRHSLSWSRVVVCRVVISTKTVVHNFILQKKLM